MDIRPIDASGIRRGADTLKVLMVTPEYPPNIFGGLGTHVVELCRGLVEAGCRVTVMAPSSNASTHGTANLRVHFVCLKDATAAFPKAGLVKKVQIYNEHVARYGQAWLAESHERPDVIHCHDWLSFRAAHVIGRAYDIPVIGTVHLLHDPLYAYWGSQLHDGVPQEEALLCQEATSLITVSQSMRAIIRIKHRTSAAIHVIYNGINAAPFASSADELVALRRSLADADQKIVLFAGRIDPQKGIDALLASASSVLARYPGTRYVLAGGTGGREETTAFLHSMFPQYSAMLRQVTIVGMVPHSELAKLFQVADLVVVPSIYEPFGYVAIEAMAAGRAVVATKVGGLAEIVQHGQTGLLVPVRSQHGEPHAVDEDQLASAQMTLLGDDATAKRMGIAGRQRVLSEFTVEKMVASTLAVYSHAIEGAAAKPPSPDGFRPRGGDALPAVEVG